MRTGRWDHIRDWLVLGVLLLASLITMLARNDPIVRGTRALNLELISSIESRVSWAGQFVGAVAENGDLRRENVLLNSQLARLNVALRENEALSAALEFKETADFNMVAARIVSKDIFGQNGFLTLDVGARDGVKPDMPAVSHQGILGRVVLVSARHSRVMSYLNTGFRVPVEVLPSVAAGMVSWSGVRSDRLQLENLVKTEVVNLGDTVITSSTSRIFPEGVPVGMIVALDTLPGLNYLHASVEPFAMISRARHAFVLLHQRDLEQVELEATPVQ